MTVIWLSLAAFAGALAGAFLLGCLVVAKRADRRMEEWKER